MELHISLVGRKNLSGEIYRQIRRAITDGRLRPGDCLPASRDLARSLRVSRTTITVAYDRLAGEGFLSSRAGASSFTRHAAARCVEPAFVVGFRATLARICQAGGVRLSHWPA